MPYFLASALTGTLTALQIGIGNLFALISSNGKTPFVLREYFADRFFRQSTERKMLLATSSDTEPFSDRSDSDSSALPFTPTSSPRRIKNEMRSSSCKTLSRSTNAQYTPLLSCESSVISRRRSDTPFERAGNVNYLYVVAKLLDRRRNGMQSSIST